MTKRMNKLTKTNKTEARAAIETLLSNLDSHYVVSNDLKTITDTEADEFYGMLYFQNGEEIIAVPDFYVAESALVFGSRGNAYEMDYETPVAA